MWDNFLPTVEAAQARLDACKEKTADALGLLQNAQSNETESALLVSSRKADQAKRLGMIAKMKEAAIVAVGTPEMEVMASSLIGYEREAELMASAVQRAATRRDADTVTVAEASVAIAQTRAAEADAAVILQQAIERDAWECFAGVVEGGMSCQGLSGIVRRAMNAGIKAAKDLASAKDDLKAMKELFQNAAH